MSDESDPGYRSPRDKSLIHRRRDHRRGKGGWIPGGVGGGAAYDSHVIFYVGVPDVTAALQKAEALGGTRLMGPARAPTGLVVGHFTDPEGNLIGVAGSA